MAQKAKKGRSQTPLKGHVETTEDDSLLTRLIQGESAKEFEAFALKRSLKQHRCVGGLHVFGSSGFAKSDVFSFTCDHGICESCLDTEITARAMEKRPHQGPLNVVLSCPECGQGAVTLQGSDVQELLNQAHTILKASPSLRQEASAHLNSCAQRFASESLSPEKTQVAKAPCGICEEAEGVFQCFECAFSLCAECRSSVHSKGRFKQHRVSDLGPSSATLPQASEPSRCATHRGYPVELYCKRCKICICLMCHYGGSCKGHEVQSLDELDASLRQELRDSKRLLQSRSTALASLATAVQGTLGEIASLATTTSTSISEVFERLLNVITLERDSLLNQVETWLKHATATAVRDQSALAAASTLLSGLSVACDVLPERERSTELVTLTNLLRSRIDGLAQWRLFADHGDADSESLVELRERCSKTYLQQLAHFKHQEGCAESLSAFMSTRIGKLKTDEVGSVLEDLLGGRSHKTEKHRGSHVPVGDTLGEIVFAKSNSATPRHPPDLPRFSDTFAIGTQGEWNDETKPKLASLTSPLGQDFAGSSKRSSVRSALTFGSQAAHGSGEGLVGLKRDRQQATTLGAFADELVEPSTKQQRQEKDGMDPPAVQNAAATAGLRMISLAKSDPKKAAPSKKMGFQMKF